MRITIYSIYALFTSIIVGNWNFSSNEDLFPFDCCGLRKDSIYENKIVHYFQKISGISFENIIFGVVNVDLRLSKAVL